MEQAQLRYWIRGDKASYKKFHLDCQEDQSKASMNPSDNSYGGESPDRAGQLTSSTDSGELRLIHWPNVKTKGYGEFYDRLASALNGQGTVPVNAEDAAQVIRLIELARTSSNKDRTLNAAEHYPSIDE